MLAHAISSTNPTAPRRASRAGCAWLTTSRCSPFTPDLQVLGLVERVDLAQPRRDCVHLLLCLFSVTCPYQKLRPPREEPPWRYLGHPTSRLENQGCRYAISMGDRCAERMHNAWRPGECGPVPRSRARQSGGATFVVVMQTADVWDRDDRAAG